MFAMGRTMALAAVFLTLSAHSEIVYQNDFASRLSLKPVPASGAWVRYDYTAGKPLAYSYGKTQLQYTENLPWSNPAKMQDGWIHGAYGTWHPVSYVTNNVDSDTSRPFAAFDLNNDTTYYKGLLYQPIDNSFSNGTLTCWIDMRVPTSWGITGAADPPQLRFFPPIALSLRIRTGFQTHSHSLRSAESRVRPLCGSTVLRKTRAVLQTSLARSTTRTNLLPEHGSVFAWW